MRIIRSPKAMQRQALLWRSRGLRVGFVPTMGYLHAGHLSLVHEARRRVGVDGVVVVSIYVNPTQFAPTEDLAKYPRDFARDSKLCREAGVDVIFAPTDSDMYAGREDGDYSTYVVEEGLTQGLEGASRPTHFRGVTTVVAKLFNCVLPEVSVFGAKDWQQAAVIRRMVKDLQFPIRIVVAPTTGIGWLGDEFTQPIFATRGAGASHCLVAFPEMGPSGGPAICGRCSISPAPSGSGSLGG